MTKITQITPCSNMGCYLVFKIALISTLPQTMLFVSGFRLLPVLHTGVPRSEVENRQI